MNILLTVLCVLFGLLLLSMAGILALAAVKYRLFSKKLRDFITAPDADSPSQFAELTHVVGQTAGKAMGMEIKTTLMGQASGQARLEKAIQADVAKDTLEANNPGLAAALTMFPSLQKRAFSNPTVLNMLMQQFNKVPAQGNGGSKGSVDYAAMLNKYK